MNSINKGSLTIIPNCLLLKLQVKFLKHRSNLKINSYCEKISFIDWCDLDELYSNMKPTVSDRKFYEGNHSLISPIFSNLLSVTVFI